MDKEILEYIRKSKPNKTLKEALNELPEEISKYFSEGDRKQKEDEFAELWLRTEVMKEKRYRITIKGVGSILKKNTSSNIWFFGVKAGDVGILAGNTIQKLICELMASVGPSIVKAWKLRKLDNGER